MKLLYLLTGIIFLACSPQKHTTAMRSTNTGFAKDSVEYYLTDIETRQKNYLTQLQKTWSLVSMQRQAKVAIENLNSHTLVFNQDMSFRLTTSCSTIIGDYEVKGTGIKFKNIASTKNANCNNQNQEDELLRLLQDRVSAYTIENRNLLLRDNATNIVFRASY